MHCFALQRLCWAERMPVRTDLASHGCVGLKECPGRIAPALLRLCWAERMPLGLRPRSDHSASDCPEVSAHTCKKHVKGNGYHEFPYPNVKNTQIRQWVS